MMGDNRLCKKVRKKGYISLVSTMGKCIKNESKTNRSSHEVDRDGILYYFLYTLSIISLKAVLERPLRTIPYSSMRRTMAQYSVLYEVTR